MFFKFSNFRKFTFSKFLFTWAHFDGGFATKDSHKFGSNFQLHQILKNILTFDN